MPGLIGLGLLILLGFHVTYSTQCDCNSSCAIYTSPVQCVRCCTHYVKRRSLPLHPAHRKRQFLLTESTKIKHPIWRRPVEPMVEESLPRLIRLLLRKPL
ncbi:uncharacterized protein CELE_D1007.19 [Caenorhabditis elegans]|uniref:Secreted protein n=1 Tax=Caenorhabditis elegans TaxID=6239 RepID=A0A9S7_CAEEL|nr:Secreted protein [Caenorhabditis elegans]CCD67331.1 Secreted protein [Caenorhabditis elegans]|eukprot:NP_001076601.1 Uncharacterized protein CELE_D1007.19 [Caenorhabditis elegans]